MLHSTWFCLHKFATDALDAALLSGATKDSRFLLHSIELPSLLTY